MPGKKAAKQLKPKRDTVSFRLLPETKQMLDRAAAQTDMTRGRYIEKALRAQFKKDAIQ
jgi:predicted transcriptional regulator